MLLWRAKGFKRLSAVVVIRGDAIPSIFPGNLLLPEYIEISQDGNSIWIGLGLVVQIDFLNKLFRHSLYTLLQMIFLQLTAALLDRLTHHAHILEFRMGLFSIIKAPAKDAKWVCFQLTKTGAGSDRRGGEP
jgi:hypothetical protein